MADSVTTLPLRGKTLLSGNGRTLAATGQSNAVEGAEKYFDDVTPSTTPGVKTKRSNRQVLCQLVRNVSGTTLYSKRLVKWKTGYEGKQVDGYTCLDHESAAGVVDEHLPATGVPNYDLFWIAKQGPTLILTSNEGDAQNVWAAGQPFTALTAATSQGSTTAGRPQPFAATSTVTSIMTIAFNRLGRAMSAKTTANTSADLLIDLNVMV